MKKLGRVIALATLSAYIGFMAIETFHSLKKNHDESHCAVCTLVHQSPAIGQGKTPLQHEQVFRRIVVTNSPLELVKAEVSYYGRSPPVL